MCNLFISLITLDGKQTTAPIRKNNVKGRYLSLWEEGGGGREIESLKKKKESSNNLRIIMKSGGGGGEGKREDRRIKNRK